VLLFNRLPSNLTITLNFRDIGDTSVSCFRVRDVWGGADLGMHGGSFEAVGVVLHGSRFLRLTPAVSRSSEECHAAVSCPLGFTANSQRGYWLNSDPCPGNKSDPASPDRFKPPHCTEDVGVSISACARKCNQTANGDCVAFELFQPGGIGGCYLFHKTLEPPFLPNTKSLTCVRTEK
jgi:hypothetical protein